MLVYNSEDLILTGYINFDFQEDKKSKNIYIWANIYRRWRRYSIEESEQSCIVDSIVETEYDDVVEEKKGVWPYMILVDLEVVHNM